MTPTQARRWVATGNAGLDDFEFVPYQALEPAAGEVRIAVHAAGVNPADLKHPMRVNDSSNFPLPIGYEVSGVITAVGPHTATGEPYSVGNPVLGFRIAGGYTTAVTVPARNVFAKPDTIDYPEAASLLLAGTTAADMLRTVNLQAGQTLVFHGASGAVGAIALQLARRAGITVIGTTSERNFEKIRSFGAIPVAYGPGLLDRVRDVALNGIDAALDAVGTDEAVTTSLELVTDHARIVTIAAFAAATQHGFRALAGSNPDSEKYRDSVRGKLISLAGSGELVVPMARTYPLDQAREALRLVSAGHAGGKVALLPEQGGQ